MESWVWINCFCTLQKSTSMLVSSFSSSWSSDVWSKKRQTPTYCKRISITQDEPTKIAISPLNQMYLLCFCAVSVTVITALSRIEEGIPTVDSTHCKPCSSKTKWHIYNLKYEKTSDQIFHLHVNTNNGFLKEAFWKPSRNRLETLEKPSGNPWETISKA